MLKCPESAPFLVAYFAHSIYFCSLIDAAMSLYSVREQFVSEDCSVDIVTTIM